MASNSLDAIVNINIDLSAPAVDAASFDHLLLVGPAPAGLVQLPVVGVYADLKEVIDAGYVAVGNNADPVGIAARIAFSQSPSPDRIYIAAQQAPNPLLGVGGDIKIITEDNYLTDAVNASPDEGVPADLPWLQITYQSAGATSLQAEIEKDGVVVWGKSLPTAANSNAYLQVALGADEMGIDPEEFAGNYTATLTATKGEVTTIKTYNVSFDGTSYVPGLIVSDTTPAISSAAETVTNALNTDGWYVVCAAGVPENEYTQIAELVETQKKMFAYTFLSQNDPVEDIFFRSQGWCGLINDNDLPLDVPVENSYLHVGAVAKCLSFPAGSETWAFKQLAALHPTDISSTTKKILTDGHSNFFAQYAGRNITMNGQVRSGEWIDVIRGRDWLHNDMQLRIFNLMLLRPKIPYLNTDIATVENAMKASLNAATGRGIVAPDEFDADGNLIPGFTTSVPNAASLTATQRASRVLTDCKFTARLPGAVHVAEINGSMTY